MAMPIYEFSCESCGARFESLVAVGTESERCPECGAERTTRVLSAPGAPFHLVKTGGSRRIQEARNAKLHADTKANFKAARKRARDAKRGGGSGGG